MGRNELLKEARKKAGLTQAELARKLGVATITIRQYESGKRMPRYEQLKAIAEVLDVQWYELVPEAEQSNEIIDHIRGKLKNSESFEKKTMSELHKLGILKFNSDFDRLSFFFEKLNPEGKSIAADRVEELAEIPRYQKEDDINAINPKEDN